MDEFGDLENDSLLKAARGTLWFCGAVYLLLGLVSLLMVVPLMLEGGEGIVVGLIMGVFMLAICGGIAAVNFVAAWGLGARKKWAWIVTIILGALYAPTGCLPLGVLLLYAMLRSGFKEAYDAEADGTLGAAVGF